MNFLAGIAVGVGGIVGLCVAIPVALGKLLGPPDPNPKDSEGNYIS